MPPQVTTIGEEPSAEVMMIKPLTTRGEGGRSLRGEEIVYWRADAF
jgi:hypothetical protein